MNFIKNRKWPYWEIGILKWTTMLFGMILGAYFNIFVRQYVWVFAVLAVLGGFQVTLFYFSKERD